MSLMTCSAGAFPVPDFCLIFAPFKGYDEPEILRSQLSQFGPISADAEQMTHMASMRLVDTRVVLTRMIFMAHTSSMIIDSVVGDEGATLIAAPFAHRNR